MRTTRIPLGPVHTISAVLALLVIVAGPMELAAAARTIVFRSASGRAIEATLNEAAQEGAPAVVLVGMLGHSRQDWQEIGQQMADARITTLAIDLPAAVVPGDPGVLSGWADEVRGAVAYLVTTGEARPGGVGIMGAALGASLAAVAAAGSPQVGSLVLVSPVLDYRGLRIENAMRQYGARPAYLMASRQDPYAARSARDLAKNPPGVREVLIADVPASGTVLLEREPDLVRLAIEWFHRTLG